MLSRSIEIDITADFSNPEWL